MTFSTRLVETCARRGSNLCVGLDPSMESLPAGFEKDPDDVLRFVTGIIEATSEFAAAFKPNSAFYEVMGAPGMEVLQAVIAAVPDGIPVILDAKRADVGNTAERYAEAAFVTYGADAVTVNPYLGRDVIEVFSAYKDKGVFVLCRTSNPGARDFQDLGTGQLPLYLQVARQVREWDTHGNLGLVAGATWAEDLQAVRAAAPNAPILIPGVGAQGGDLTAAVRAGRGDDGEQPFLVAVARAISEAGTGADFQHAAADAARHFRDQIQQVPVGTPILD